MVDITSFYSNLKTIILTIKIYKLNYLRMFLSIEASVEITSNLPTIS